MTPRRADVLLLVITAIWGTTFAIGHATMARFPPFALVATRFTIASVIVVVWAVFRRELTWRATRAGLVLGVLLFAGFATQTWGLARTTPARAGFITGLSVVFVPLLARPFGDRVTRRVMLAVVVSTAGLAVLSWGCEWSLVGCSTFESALPERALGDRFVLLCAVAYSLYVIGVNRWTEGLPTVAVNAIQFLVVAGLSGLAALALERPLPPPTPAVWAAILFLAFVATLFTFSVMLVVQPHTTATRATLIYSLEAVFAALFSWMWLGEVPSASVWIGGTLMFAAVFIVEWPAAERQRSLRPEPRGSSPDR